ncbi:MAG: hypothetical protein MUD11_07370 [Rhodobacteraceae bacterium]|jgi:hypothetical protein|nr:hypothetical protein [Paracoccaceae bacterium]
MFLLAMALPVAAMAQDPRRDMFPSDGACYLRFYRADHLARHPDQRVKQFAIGPDAGQTTVASLALRLQVQTRDSSDFYTGLAYCHGTGAGLSCQVEGDGGGFTLQPRDDGAVQLALTSAGLVLEGASGFLDLSGTKGDDRIFRLPPVPADSCP